MIARADPGGPAAAGSAASTVARAGLLLVVAALTAGAPAGAAPPAHARAQVRIAYEEPGDAALRPIRERLRQRKVLETLAEILGTVRLPQPLSVAFAGCSGDVDAWYDPETRAITFCYELVADFERAAAGASRYGISRDAAVDGPVTFVLLHEASHALFDLLQVPILGKEEDAADRVAAYVLLRSDPQTARRVLSGTAWMYRSYADATRPEESAFADVHALDAQRLYDVLCLAYGRDAEVFKGVVEKKYLPEDRAAGCHDEWRQLAYAVRRLLSGSVDAEAVKRVRERHRLRWKRAEATSPEVPLNPSTGPPTPSAGPAEPARGRGAGEPCTSSSDCARRLGRGHVCSEGRCAPYFDRRDLYGALGLRTAAPSAPQPLVPLVAAVPAIGYSPSSGLLFGLAGTMGMLLGDPEDTTISSATGTLLYTSKNQVIVGISATAMTSGNVWELLSDWRYLLFNQDTYGLGTGQIPEDAVVTLNGWGDVAGAPGAQPMDFDLLRLHQSALHHVTGSLYLGGGLRLDRYQRIVDHALDLAAAPPVITSHYAYSLSHRFDPTAYTASGLSLEALHDSRDSTIAPYRGVYAHLRFTGYPTWLGSTRTSTVVAAEGRSYFGLSDADPRNLIAVWALASAVTSGDLPYLALPASGWDARSTSGRGYVQGRFRGTAMVDVEAEWRFRLSADGLFGGAVFASAQSFARPPVHLPDLGVDDHGEDLLETIRPAAGAGLRVMLLKQSRTALRVDVGFGVKSVAFYLGAGEAF